MRTVSFTSPYDAQQAQIQREQDYADQLMQQSQQPLQGGMAGRMYVPPHATQGLAQLAQALSGRMASNAAGEKMTGLANDRAKAYADALGRYTQTGDPGALMSNPDTAAYGMTAQQAKQKALADALQAEETERLRAERERAGRIETQTFTAEQNRLAREAAAENARIRAEAARAAANNGGMGPSSIQEWQVFSAMPREDQERYLTMKRAQQWNDTGGSLQAPNPVNPAAPPLAVVPKTPTPEQAATRNEAQTARSQALGMYETAREGLESGLEGASTGPFVGRLPALTSDAQIAEGSVAAMAPILKQIFRTAGEGTFTDKDQEMLLRMVPTRTDRPEARKEKLRNIDNIVRAKLGAPVGAGGANPGGAPSGGFRILGIE